MWVFEISFLWPLGRMDWRGKIRGRETNEGCVMVQVRVRGPALGQGSWRWLKGKRHIWVTLCDVTMLQQ